MRMAVAMMSRTSKNFLPSKWTLSCRKSLIYSCDGSPFWMLMVRTGMMGVLYLLTTSWKSPGSICRSSSSMFVDGYGCTTPIEVLQLSSMCRIVSSRSYAMFRKKVSLSSAVSILWRSLDLRSLPPAEIMTSFVLW